MTVHSHPFRSPNAAIQTAKRAIASAAFDARAGQDNRAAVRAQLVVAQTAITEALAIVDAGLASAAGARLEGVG